MRMSAKQRGALRMIRGHRIERPTMSFARILMGIIVQAALLGGSATVQARTSDCLQRTGYGYVQGFNADKTSVIVFVHGVLSDATTAWTNNDPPEPTFWPCLLLDDDKYFAESNLYVHAYPTTLSDSPSIDEVAERLYRDLRNAGTFDRGVFGHRNVSFVAHSMGGLVVSRMLMRQDFARGDLERIRLVMFYGTPGNGAEIAEIGRRLTGGKQFAEMSNPTDLQPWTARFNSTPWPFNRVCLAEGADMGPMRWLPSWMNPLSVRVVGPASAAALCNGKAPILAGFDHSSLVKPTPQRIEPHRRLRLEYGDCIRPLLGANNAAFDASDDVRSHVADWFNELKDKLLQPPDGKDRITLVQERAFPDQYSYPVPPESGEPSFEAADYKWWPVRAFANEAESFMRQHQLERATIDWVSNAKNAGGRLADQAFIALLRAPGVSMETDVVVALKSPASVKAGKPLLLMRLADKPTTSDAPRKWLRGVLFVPTEKLHCGNT
jgi:pimeloyl-ACP methyl ester carboxylesterase